MALVYLITNQINGKRYVGITTRSIDQRWREHAYMATTTHTNTRLARAIRKYGVGNFVIEQVASCLTDPQAVERSVIESLRPEYNQTNGGEITVGRRVSKEVVEKIAAKNRGQKRTEAQRKKNSEIKKSQYAEYPELRETTEANLEKARMNVDREKQRAAAGKSSKERIWSDESRAKLSESCMGRKLPQEAIDRMAEKKNKPVECVETGTKYRSILEASAATGICFSNISRVCLGKRKTAGGYTFRFTTSTVF